MPRTQSTRGFHADRLFKMSHICAQIRRDRALLYIRAACLETVPDHDELEELLARGHGWHSWHGSSIQLSTEVPDRAGELGSSAMCRSIAVKHPSTGVWDWIVRSAPVDGKLKEGQQLLLDDLRALDPSSPLLSATIYHRPPKAPRRNRQAVMITFTYSSSVDPHSVVNDALVNASFDHFLA